MAGTINILLVTLTLIIQVVTGFLFLPGRPIITAIEKHFEEKREFLENVGKLFAPQQQPDPPTAPAWVPAPAPAPPVLVPPTPAHPPVWVPPAPAPPIWVAYHLPRPRHRHPRLLQLRLPLRHKPQHYCRRPTKV